MFMSVVFFGIGFVLCLVLTSVLKFAERTEHAVLYRVLVSIVAGGVSVVLKFLVIWVR